MDPVFFFQALSPKNIPYKNTFVLKCGLTSGLGIRDPDGLPRIIDLSLVSPENIRR